MTQRAAESTGGAGAPRPLKVFVSYRREDVPDATYRLVEGLEARFGVGNVFVDVDHISPGRPFAEVISASVAKSDVFLAIIGDRWLGERREGGAPRIKTSGDFVRLEVEAALESGVPVVPVLIEDAPVPQREDLPKSMARLPGLQAFKIARSHWRYDVERLEGAIVQIAGTHVPAPTPPRQSGPGPAEEAHQPRPRTRLLAAAVAVAVAVAAIVVLASKGPSRTQASVPLHATPPSTGTGTTALATPGHTGTGTTAVDPARTNPAHAVTPPAAHALGPEQIVSRYWQEIDAHRFAAAYAYLDPEYRQEESKSTFVGKHEAEGIKEATFRGESASDSGSSARVNVVSLRTSDDAKGCREWNGYYGMRSVEGRWLIHEAQIKAFRRCQG